MSWIERIGTELTFSVSRSGGPGGQNVNKVNSKVTLKFDIVNSQTLSPDEKDILKQKLATWTTKEGVLILIAQSSRSQLDNKKSVILKLEKLFAKAFERRKKRVVTKPSKSSVQKRIQNKKQHSEKKKWRQKL